jgi:two-component system, cell cycle response regulator
MRTDITVYEPPVAIGFITQTYARLLLAGAAVLPAYLIAYLFFFQNPAQKFDNHLFYEIAIAAATIEGLFVAYLTWRCYHSSGEPLLRWLTLGFIGFVLIYALRGVFTELSDVNLWLFLLYGPASRLTMSILLFVGLLSYYRAPDDVEKRSDARDWQMWIGLFVLEDIVVAYLANSDIAGAPAVRLSMEGGALFFSTLNVAAMLVGRIHSPLMAIFGISVAWFALSSLAFLLAHPWNHMWWLAHAIFAAGFFLLSYGIVRAFLTTRSFSTVYSQEDLMSRLTESMARTKNVSQELQRISQELEYLVATDQLTGAGNRRQFIERVDAEIARVKRGGDTFSLLSLDLDHFKMINDSYGHQVGDAILREFVQKCRYALRPYDSIARMGGEEFMVLLPGTTLETARSVGERVRSAIADSAFNSGIGSPIGVTISVGISEFRRDRDTLEAILRVVDERLYRAKYEGRNRVIAA